MVEDLRIIGTVSVLDNRLLAHCKLYIKQACRRYLQSGGARTISVVEMMEGNYQSVLQYWKDHIDRNFERKDELTVEAERGEPYLQHDRTMFSIEGMVRAADPSDRRGSAISSTSRFVQRFKRPSYKCFWQFLVS